MVFIKETHFKHDKTPRLSNHHFLVVYNSTSDNSKSKGIAILVPCGVPWEEDQIIRDGAERLLIVLGSIAGQEVTLVNLYAPNSDQVSFMDTCVDSIGEHKNSALFVGGNLNLALDPLMDSSKGSTHLLYAALAIVWDLCSASIGSITLSDHADLLHYIGRSVLAAQQTLVLKSDPIIRPDIQTYTPRHPAVILCGKTPTARRPL